MTLKGYNTKLEKMKDEKRVDKTLLKTFLKAVGIIVKAYGPPDDFRLIINGETNYKWLTAIWNNHEFEVSMGEEIRVV
jgi:hypothetical protein